MANFNNIVFKFDEQVSQGDTVEVFMGDLYITTGIVHIPKSTIMPAIILIKISENTKECYEINQRKTFEIFNHGHYLMTKIVLTEKNIYKSLHGASSRDVLWEATEGFYRPEY